jgi:hypothetical protein
MHPDKLPAYLVALIYLPLAVVTVASAVNKIATFLLYQREERRQRAEVLKLVKSWETIGSMDRDQDGEVSLSDFMSYLLRLWGLVDDHTLRLIEDRYNELDVGGDGILRREHFSGRGGRRPPGRGLLLSSLLVGGGGGERSGVITEGSCEFCGCTCGATVPRGPPPTGARGGVDG